MRTQQPRPPSLARWCSRCQLELNKPLYQYFKWRGGGVRVEVGIVKEEG